MKKLYKAKNITDEEREKKPLRTFVGTGTLELSDKSYSYHATNENSDLLVYNTDDLDSCWKVTQYNAN